MGLWKCIKFPLLELVWLLPEVGAFFCSSSHQTGNNKQTGTFLPQSKKIPCACQLVEVLSSFLICRAWSLLWRAVPKLIYLFFCPAGNSIYCFIALLQCFVLSSSSRLHIRIYFMIHLTNLGQESWSRAILVIQRDCTIFLSSYIQYVRPCLKPKIIYYSWD